MVEIVLIIFLFFILAILSLSLRVEIIDFTSYNFKESKFKIKLKVYVFKFLKLFEITFSESGVRLFKKDIKYKYSFMEFLGIIFSEENRKLLKIFTVQNYKSLKIKLKSFDLKLKFGVFENMITNFLVTIVSTLVSVFIGSHMSRLNRKRFYFKIDPKYDELYFDMSLNLKFEIKTFSIYKFILGNKDRLKDLYRFMKSLNVKDTNVGLDVGEDIVTDGLTTKNKKLKESSI